MKNINARKIVLYSISLFSAIMLLIGLSFKVLAYDLGLDGAAADALDNAGMAASGFDMISFKLPTILRTSVFAYIKKSTCSLYETLIGVTSLISLIVSLLSIAGIIFAFFKFERKKGEKLLVLIVIIGVIVALAHSVLCIIFSSNVQSGMTKLFDKTGVDNPSKFKTSAYISLIFQALCLVGYIVCAIKIKHVEKEVVSTSNNDKKESAIALKESAQQSEEKLENLLSAELSVISLLKEYKALYEESIITSADYMEKKVKLMKASDKKIKQTASVLISKISFLGVIKAETTVINLLREYKKLLDSAIISDADYVEKKVSLLNYIIA